VGFRKIIYIFISLLENFLDLNQCFEFKCGDVEKQFKFYAFHFSLESFRKEIHVFIEVQMSKQITI